MTVATDDVADTFGLVAFAPAAPVVTGRDCFDVEPVDVDLIAGGDLGDLREPEVLDEVPTADWHDEVRVAVDRFETPAIEVIDVRVRDEDGVDASCAARAPRQQRI